MVFISREVEDIFNYLDDYDFIKKSMKKAVSELRVNAFAGTHIPKRLIPAIYKVKYEIKNLWKYDMPKGWRLIYTVTANNDVELISAILEWFDHKEYERRFKY